MVERAARTLGINDGPVKGDIVYTSTGPVLLEIAPRFHGDVSTSFVTPFTTGFNPIKTWFAYLAGNVETRSPDKMKENKAAGWMAVFPEASGSFTSIQGIESALALEHVRDILVIKQKGAFLECARDNTSVCGFIFVNCDSRENVGKLLKEARERLRVITE